MGRLVYATICSLDGRVADASGSFDWAAPDEEVHAAVNEVVARVGTQLLGRRTYEVLTWWEDVPDLASEPPVVQEFARLWAAQDKVVYSTTLQSVATARTRVAPDFDVPQVRALMAGSDADVSVGGPTLAAAAFAAGLVDDVHLFVHPVVIGGGTRALPDGVRLDLELVSTRAFASGVVHLRYTRRP